MLSGNLVSQGFSKAGLACSPRNGTTISRRSIACENVEIGVELAADFGPRSDLGHHHDGGRVAGNGRPPGSIGKPVLRIVMVTTQAAGFGQYSEYPEYLEYFFGHSQPDADGNAMAQKEFREFKVFGLIGWPVADGTFPVRAGIGSRPIPWYIIFRSSRLPPSCV